MSNTAATWARDPAFGLGRPDRLDPPLDTDLEVAWRHHTSQVVRDPLDLEAHTRRVLLACAPAFTGRSDRADGALIDLFHAVGHEGLGLKRHLLAQAGTALSPAVQARLSAWLATGRDAGGAWPAGCSRALGADALGRTDLVTRERVERAAETPLQQAVALIDEGQLDAARALMEAALLADPDQPELARELLGLYHSLRDTEAPAALGAQLRERHQRLPAGWP